MIPQFSLTRTASCFLAWRPETRHDLLLPKTLDVVYFMGAYHFFLKTPHSTQLTFWQFLEHTTSCAALMVSSDRLDQVVYDTGSKHLIN